MSSSGSGANRQGLSGPPLKLRTTSIYNPLLRQIEDHVGKIFLPPHPPSVKRGQLRQSGYSIGDGFGGRLPMLWCPFDHRYPITLFVERDLIHKSPDQQESPAMTGKIIHMREIRRQRLMVESLALVLDSKPGRHTVYNALHRDSPATIRLPA